MAEVNPSGYAQVLNESFSGSTSGNREASHTYVYGLERISETRSYLVNSQSLTQRIFYVYDGHGSVRALTDSTGAVTDTYDYDAFGKLIHSTGTTPNIYLYSGEQFDPDLNLYYNRARYLNVSTGRFWSMDAFEGDPEAPLSLHKYLFVGADPIDAVDPSGYDFGDIAISLAIQGVLSASVSGLITYGITRNVKKSLAAAAGGFVLGVVFGAAGQVVKGLFVARAAGALALAAEDTLITADKLRYLLELDAGKALGFKLLGYTLENVEDLEAVLQASRQLITEETERVVTQYGTKYAVQMEIIGANGMRGLIQVVWQQDIGSTIFRLITAIPKPYGVFYF